MLHSQSTVPFLALCLVASGLLACDDEKSDQDATAATASAATTSEKKTAPEPDEPEEKGVEIIGKGESPRALLRYAPKPGQKETVKLVSQKANVDLEGKEVKSPRSELTLLLTFEEKKGDALHYAVEVTGLAPKGEAAATVRAALDKLTKEVVGAEGKLVVSDRGLVRSLDMSPPENASEQAKMVVAELDKGVRELIAVLPTARVGKGAHWKHVSELDIGGMKVSQSRTYELVSGPDGTLELDTTSTQTADDQPMQYGGGMKVNVRDYAATGSGRATADLAHLVPEKRTSTVKTSMKMQGGGRAEKTVRATIIMESTGRID